MEEGFHRFLLRHRTAVGAGIVGLLLIVLALSTLMVRNVEEEASPATVELEDRPTPEDADGPPPSASTTQAPVDVESTRVPAASPQPAGGQGEMGGDRTPAEADLESAPPASGYESHPAPEARPLKGLLGSLGGVADREGWTALLGAPSLALEGNRLRWSTPVMEDGFDRLALGLPLEAFGGSGIWWTVAEIDGGDPGPFRVGGEAELDAPLAEALRRADGPVAVQLGAYRIDDAGLRYLVASYAGTAGLSR